MNSAPDMRIPVLFGPLSAEPGDAYLVEQGQPMPTEGYALVFTQADPKPGHAIFCLCCAPRGAAAEALARMHRARATGAAPFYRRVIVLASAAGAASVRRAIADDVVAAARFRLR